LRTPQASLFSRIEKADYIMQRMHDPIAPPDLLVHDLALLRIFLIIK
jgi:hypothetical protein